MSRDLILILLVLFSGVVIAEGIKVVDEFTCHSKTATMSDDFLITALVKEEKQKEFMSERLLSTYNLPAQRVIKVVTGELKIGSTIHNTAYSVADLDKRWAFGPAQDDDPNFFRYAFVIKPDGVGKMYDFNLAGDDGLATPQKYYECVNTTENTN